MPDAPRIGTEFAGYRIDSLIGRGGMSIVYRAENPRLGNMVALKLLSSELANDETFRERFVRESRLAAALNHPHIIPIYDAGSADGMLYIAMRYVEGADLKQLIRSRGALPPEQTVALLAQVARALDAAHRRGLVHRDVKPANILVERDEPDDAPGHAYLADFGLMKHPASRSGLTATGQFMGTIDYVAPEQIEGKEVDARTDEYSLGCVLYECLTGQVPFVKDADVAVMWAHMNEAPPPVSSLRPEVPAAIDGVITRALAKAPDDRYHSCSEMVAAAAAALGGAATVAEPTRPSPAAVPALAQPTEPESQPTPEPAPLSEQATRPATPPSPPPKPIVSAHGGGGRSRAGLLVAVLLVATLVGAGAAYAIHRSSGDSSAAGSTHGSSTGPATTTDGQMNLAMAFKQQMPDNLVASCQFADAIKCMNLPPLDGPQKGKTGQAGQMTLTPYMNGQERAAAFTNMLSNAPAIDGAFAGFPSGRCTGGSWEKGDYWYHTPETQATDDHGADGDVFCYTNAEGDKVIVWTQDTMGMTGVPMIGEVLAKSKLDAFRTFYYVHHHIGM
jgi:serine/threonine protein kinase